MSGNKLFDGLRIAPHTHPLRLARRSCAHCAAHRHSLTACLTHRSQQSTINLPIPRAADSNQQPSLTHSLTHRQSLKLTQNSNSNSNSKLAVAIFAFRCPNLEFGIWFIHSLRSLTHSLTVKSINRRFDAATRRLSFAVSLSQHARSSLVFLCTVLLHFFPHLKHTHRHRTHPRDRTNAIYASVLYVYLDFIGFGKNPGNIRSCPKQNKPYTLLAGGATANASNP